ncbi:MAG TPA: type II secretion system protein [Phycisphaerales bacterium]|nr:type II secretion system protein [Phycisphaerales bacterium]
MRSTIARPISRAPGVRRRSYTLIELLIVCAILGIAGALLIPQIVGRDIMACQSAVRLIIGDISFAQSDALAHQEYRRIHFDADGMGYSISRVTQTGLGQPFNASTADFIHDPLEGGDYVVSIGSDDRFSGVTIASVNIDGNGRDLNFDALGGTVTSTGTVGSGGTIVVSSANDSYRITIAPFTGKITVVQL